MLVLALEFSRGASARGASHRYFGRRSGACRAGGRGDLTRRSRAASPRADPKVAPSKRKSESPDSKVPRTSPNGPPCLDKLRERSSRRSLSRVGNGPAPVDGRLRGRIASVQLR
jgi:hypothetical protein